MAEIINLRRARKAKARAEAGQQAAANRALHGQGKAQKKVQASLARLEARRLDGHLRDEPHAKKTPDSTSE